MDGIHEMAAELFVRIMAAKAAAASGLASAQTPADTARDSYIFARAFYDEHGRHLERGA